MGGPGKAGGKGGKATPPPPPPGKGKGKGALPPGAPPLPKASGGAAKFDGPKLRPLFWQPVAQIAPQSVWSSLVPPVHFDKSALESRFALSETRSLTRKGTGTSSTSSLHGEESRKRVRVLDDRTSQMLAIAFNFLPPPEQLDKVVAELANFPEGLPSEGVIALNSAATEHQAAVEQICQLNLAESDLGQLDVPERYLWVLGTKTLCAAKLACGAVILGMAPELPELREACDKIRICCQKIRSSDFVLKCISTSLAVGNLMNRGTARSGAHAVVLPDALLKLEEMRGSSDSEGVSGPSLLDFVTEAMVLDKVATKGDRQAQFQLKKEVEDLLHCVRAAEGVCVGESEASCKKICMAATKAQQGLGGHLVMPSVASLAARIQGIREEAEHVTQILETAKQEMQSSMEWSSAKADTKGSEWLHGWSQFLDQFAQAIGRSQLPAVLPAQPQVVPAPEVVPARAESFQFRDVTNEATGKMSHGVNHEELKVPPSSCMMEPVTRQALQPTKKKEQVQLDDDERVEVLLARMAAQGPAPASPSALPVDSDPSEQASRTSFVTMRRRPEGQLKTRVPVIYDFDGKENLLRR
eukprot:TRINITY_DN106034_c0_g1_i1.p1 TRINITY_DN106034_c0_g1~~TRINITY_DN106034_c0_g1_i1.p1  ORF type:complete len:584 (+),score=132.09 TRINITY_DN106034_c0_g1_i1:64-1815(+)